MSHAFPAAVVARDADALIGTLAPDVTLHSAVTKVPFQGRDVVGDTYRSVIESFDELRIVEEFEGQGTLAFFWEGRMGGRPVAGADRVRLDAEGRVREITVTGRPLSGLAMFLAEIGFRLARRRRGAVVARLLRVTSLPLPTLLSAVDPLARWIAR